LFQTEAPPPAKTSSSGATAAQDGYDYQLAVSILAALQLLLISKSAAQITLEPANDEDLEADLEPDVLGRVEPHAEVAEGHRLIVQVKYTDGGPWSVEGIRALLNHGKRRKPAKEHLDDPRVRFLLITNADVANVARGLKVDGLEEWPDPTEFPASLRDILTKAPEGRLAVWGQMQRRLVDSDIDDILQGLLRIPDDRMVQCRAMLRDEASRRMRGTSPGAWTREDLLASVRACGGFLASAAELEDFVPPANFRMMADALATTGAVVITGPSGTGKTTTALALCELARKRQRGLSIVPVDPSAGPASARTLTDTGSKLFYIEDPWGQYSLIDSAESWTTQLPRLLKDARPGKQYVVTSRTDMLRGAQAEGDLKRWSIALDAEQYEDGQLARIYDKRLNGLPSRLQSDALSFRKDVLEALQTPLELSLFFDNLALGPKVSEQPHALQSRLLALARRGAVSGEVVRYLRASGQAGQAAIIWAILVARNQFDRGQFMVLQRHLRTQGRPEAADLMRLVDRLVATRHLRQPSRTVSFAHPSVREGFEGFLRQNWVDCEPALEALIAALTQLGTPHRDWGMETAARLIRVVEGFILASKKGAEMRQTADDDDVVDPDGEEATDMIDAAFQVDHSSRKAVDAWLEEGLLDPRSDFKAIIELASDVGTKDSTPAELSRWFITGVQRGAQFFMDKWTPPNFDDGWYERVTNDGRSRSIADRFIREVMPRDHAGYGSNFPERLDRIAKDLTPAYLAAAQRMVGWGFDRNVDAVATGAARDLAAYEAVVTAALDEVAASERKHRQSRAETWRAIEDGECDAGYEEGFQSQHEEDGYSDGVLVAAYVEARRRAGEWALLASHMRSGELAWYWARSVQLTDKAVGIGELRALINAARAGGVEHEAWDAVRAHWNEALAQQLEARILDLPSETNLRNALVRCALGADARILERCFARLDGIPADFVQLLTDVHGVRRFYLADEAEGVFKALLSSLSPAAVDIFEALPRGKKAARSVGDEARRLLEHASVLVGQDVLSNIMPVLLVTGCIPTAAIERWLDLATDRVFAAEAAGAAVAIEDEKLVWRALGHSRADARQVALAYLALLHHDPLPAQLLNLADDPGSRVRRALVALLAARPHPDHLGTLKRLVGDEWSDAELHHDEPESNPIAREAIAALHGYGLLAEDIGDALVALAERTKDDLARAQALALAARQCGPHVRARIWGLALREPASWTSVDAIDALVLSDTVEPEVLAQVTSDLLLRLAPPLAASAVALLSVHGKIVDAESILEKLGYSNRHRALVLVGVTVLLDRDRAAAERLMNLFEPHHPIRALLTLGDGEKLPSTVLDDLGTIRLRNAVLKWLSGEISSAR
jgi:energy-coupling factor transporter ATP-binding protein EcfA2